MDYESFKEQFVEDVKDRLYEQGAEVNVSVHEVNKLNESYEAITVTPEGSNIGVNIGIDKFYDAIENGRSYDEVVDKAVEVINNGISQRPDFDIDSLTDYSKMKGTLAMEVVSAEANQEMLATVPHQNMEDMAVVYRFVLNSDDEGRASILVTNQMLETMGVTPEQLHADAMENAPQIRPAEIKGMSEVMAEMMGVEQAEMMGIFGIPASMEGSAMVKIKDIYPFKDHPFKVLDDEKMEELVESIKANGVLSPVLVRPRTPEQGYEMISGHRRLHASKKAGLEYIPAIIKEMSDDEATIAMVDSNVQREEILPSERAWSFKMKMDALRHQGARTDLEDKDMDTSATEWPRLSVERIGLESGLKKTQVKKYIRLTELIPPLLSMVDNKELPISMAVDISYFNQEVQEWFYEYHRANKGIKPAQIKALKELQNIDNITKYTFTATMNGAVPNKYGGGVNLSERKLNAFFPPRMAAKERERIIIELLTKWKEEQK